jgi:hypothetical protein
MRNLERPRWTSIALLGLAMGCSYSTALQSPPAPVAGDLLEVVVAPTSENEPKTVIRDRFRIEAIAKSFAFSAAGWSAGDGRDLAPVYRIEFHGHSPSTYWLGLYPQAVSVPIYFYSTWWISPSTRTGEIDRGRIKGLADTVKFGLFHDLGL